MCITIKFIGMDAVLSQYKHDIGYFEFGFFPDFAAERRLRGFTPSYFAAGNAPEIGPLVGAHQQHFAGRIENESTNRDYRDEGLFRTMRQRFELEVVLLENLPEFAQMLTNQVRLGSPQLFEGIVTGQHSAGVNSPMARSFNVVLHVPDEERFLGTQFVFLEDFVDFLALVPHPEVGPVKQRTESARALLCMEVILSHSTEKKGANSSGAAEFEKFPRVWQGAHGILNLAKPTMKPLLQLGHGNMWKVLLIKTGERKAEFRAKSLQTHGGSLGLKQDVICRIQHRRQVVHQRARPIEDDVANHEQSVARREQSATESRSKKSRSTTTIADRHKSSPPHVDSGLRTCYASSCTYNARVLDIRLIRDRPDFVRQLLATRGAGEDKLIEDILRADERRRKALSEVEVMKSLRNRISKEIGELMARKRGEEAEARKQETRNLGDRINALDQQATEAETARNRLMLSVPNLPHPSVPVGGGAEDNVVLRLCGEKPALPFQPKSHVELCEKLKLVDFGRGAKLAGSGFVLFTDWGARLERALIQFMLDLHIREHGYTEVSPPFVVGPHCLEGVGQFPKFKDQYYGLAEGDRAEELGRLYLIPTAETPVANIHREEILREGQLPIRYCAYTPCFRGEAGAAGVGTRGMIRVHQFDKVELIKIVKPEDGYAEHEKMLADAERVLQALGLHYRVVYLCTADLGFASAKTYDLEVWAAGQGSYLEVSSVSNCEDFQARRMNLRYKAESGENRFPHVLNGSGTALARLFVSLIETYQQPDGGVAVPEVLQPYLKTKLLRPD